ncbi:MAG: ABC transporter permease [Nitrospinota bacterium]
MATAAATTAEATIPQPTEKPSARIWRVLKRNRLAMGGMCVLIVFFLAAVLGWLGTSGPSPVFDAAAVRLPDKLRPPLSRPTAAAIAEKDLPALGVYLLGTDELGRDVFTRMLEGARVSLSVGFVSVGIAILLGVTLGGLAGYLGQRWRWVDTLFIGLVDIQLSFPTFFLILTVIALLPPSIWNVMIVIGITGWVGPARFVRAEILSLREQEFVLAARSLGAGGSRLIFRHLLPNSMGPVLISGTIGIATAILTEAGLSFLGFGVPPPDATWGNILSDGKKYLFDAPWLTYVPGIAILVVVLSFNLFGEGLRDALNPRLRGE